MFCGFCCVFVAIVFVAICVAKCLMWTIYIVLLTNNSFWKCLLTYEPRHEKTVFCIYAKTKTQISFAVTAKLISAFVFATRIVQSLYYLNPKFQTSRHILWLYSPVCVGPGRKPIRLVFSQRGSYECYGEAQLT